MKSYSLRDEIVYDIRWSLQQAFVEEKDAGSNREPGFPQISFRFCSISFANITIFSNDLKANKNCI